MKMQCRRCRFEGEETDFELEEAYAATRETPAEYELHCPDCHSNDIIDTPEIYCCICTVNSVDYVGGICWTCQEKTANDS
jgi:hypothetical protein